MAFAPAPGQAHELSLAAPLLAHLPAAPISVVGDRGGLSTTVHVAVRGLGCPVRLALTPGQTGDAPQAETLIEGVPATFVIVYATNDNERLSQAIARNGARAVIPYKPPRTKNHLFSRYLQKGRHLIECCFGSLKQFRRGATATRKRHATILYLAIATLAAKLLRQRSVSTPSSRTPRTFRFVAV